MLTIVPVVYHRDVEWNRFARRHNAALAFRDEIISIVLEMVHPGNLGVLPPAPMQLVRKARDMGLISYDEVLKCESVDRNYYGQPW